MSITDDAHHLANSIVGTGGGLEVEAQSLDHFIEQTGHPTIDLLKMNIEGAERGAMLGLDKQAGKVRHVAISCHDFVADAGGSDDFRTREFVQPALEGMGFVIQRQAEPENSCHRDTLYGPRG